jgi:hypothetical protein
MKNPPTNPEAPTVGELPEENKSDAEDGCSLYWRAGVIP